MMPKAYKTTSIKSLPSINTVLKILVFVVVLSACQTEKVQPETSRLTDREVTFEKGKALFNNLKYTESAAFFLKVSQNPVNQNDEIYNVSLWNLSFIYEKIGEYEKSILALNELEGRKSKKILLFSIRLRLMKNYLRVANPSKTAEIQKRISTNDLDKLFLAEIYTSLEENVQFNYDHLMLEELKFLGEVQKYFITVMESQSASYNTKATELLISIYEAFLKVLEKDTLNNEFKRTIAIELLDQFRKFDRYKLSEINVNPYTISKFSNYSTEKQILITDWLHR